MVQENKLGMHRMGRDQEQSTTSSSTTNAKEKSKPAKSSSKKNSQAPPLVTHGNKHTSNSIDLAIIQT
jgi:hypothetical protein